MKKATRVLLIMMLIVALTACNKPSGTKPGAEAPTNTQTTKDSKEIKPEKDASLLLWDNKDGEGKWAKYVAKEFTKKYGIRVKYQNVNHTDVPSKLKVDGPAGLAADVFNAPHDQVGSLAKSGLLFENMVANEYKKDFMKVAIDATSVNENGKKVLYGFPISIETYALYYNKDLVDKPAKTWEELFAQAKEFSKGSTKNNPKYGFMMEPGNFYYTHAFLAGYGGYVFGNENTNPNQLGLNNKGAVKSGEFMQRIHKELLPLKVEDISSDVISTLFNEGKLMYRISGPWDVKNHLDAGVNLGVTPLPKLDNNKSPKSFSGIKSYFVNPYSKYPKAATLLAQFATSKEMLEKRYEFTGQIPPRNDLVKSDIFTKDPISMAFLKQVQKAVPMPNIPEMEPVWGPMGTAYTTIWNNNQDPQKAFDSAVKQIKETIKIQQR
ncbi:sugar ABC transporter substrate-binding protein (plasmid) [Priestia aryabhattai]|uniref:sugar ABC transporter substrate-binding protein n=1 Tax=Priestia aryabhattai TaxID=412384 RepID=UPI002452F260|nr:maltose ABC transporter substrate-binding protein [Priestia aryabhattai]MDH3135395.1 maltose ABC transporter substrate-binding protein [Priestia aryabhattai]